MNSVRIVFPRDVWEDLDHQMRSHAPAEHGLFLLAAVGQGPSDTRLLIERCLVGPESPAFDRQSAHALRPSGQHLSAAVGEAVADCSALVFIHSHPDARHPSGLSAIDAETSASWAHTLVPLLEMPFASLVWSPGGVEGVAYDAARVELSTSVEVLGGRRRLPLSGRRHMTADEIDDRQFRALGDFGNHYLRQLSVAVVGAGGTGSVLSEQLVRMGVRSLVVIDHDTLDTASNLRRVIGSRQSDLESRTPKAEIVARYLRSLGGLGSEIFAVVGDVRDDGVALKLIDVDVIMNTTDTHSSRATLNQLALQYGVALIDVGASVGTSIHGVTGMPAEVRVVLPDGPCLWCLGVLDPARIRQENLPLKERAQLAAEGYGANVDEPVPSLAALNGLAASLAASTLLRLHSDQGLIGSRVIMDGWEWYAQLSTDPVPPCAACNSVRWKADRISRLTRPDRPFA